jgi:hypothetical protein
MLTKRHGSTVKRHFARGKQDYDISFLGGAAAQTIDHQDEALVTGITRSSDGVYVLALGSRFKRVYAYANCEKDGDITQTCIVADGNQDNTVTVYTYVAGTLDDIEAQVSVHMELVDSGGT